MMRFQPTAKAAARALARRAMCAQAGAAKAEARLAGVLEKELGATVAEVRDVSGGCGSMYKVLVVSPRFDGLSLVKQHRLVKEALAEDIAGMHGLTVLTKTPKQWDDMQAAAKQ